jgi:hypothetical protein
VGITCGLCGMAGAAEKRANGGGEVRSRSVRTGMALRSQSYREAVSSDTWTRGSAGRYSLPCPTAYGPSRKAAAEALKKIRGEK